jgi:hypothetical protein
MSTVLITLATIGGLIVAAVVVVNVAVAHRGASIRSDDD